MTDARTALEAAARIGPYFAWQPWDGDPAFRPLAELRDDDVLTERVATGRETLARLSGLQSGGLQSGGLQSGGLRSGGLRSGDIEERAVASIMFLGLASRLLSPLLGAAVVGGALPVPDPDRMWWRPVESGPMPVAWTGLKAVGVSGPEGAGIGGLKGAGIGGPKGAGTRSPEGAGIGGPECAGTGGPEGADTSEPGAAAIADELHRTAIPVLVEPVLEAYRRRFVLSPKVLWGNVASALGGALGMIARAVPEHAGSAAAVVAATLDRGPLRGTATLLGTGALTRHNCCLYYRIPGGGTCGDCVLTGRIRRS